MTVLKLRLGDPSDLPAGKFCGDCRSFQRCVWLISANTDDARCDWEPSRFVEKSDPEPSPESRDK